MPKPKTKTSASPIARLKRFCITLWHNENPAPKGVSKKGSAGDLNRFYMVWAVCVLAFGLLFVRAAHLQLINAQNFIDRGDQVITGTRTVPIERGRILDRNGTPLAVSAPLAQVNFDPYAYAKEVYRLKRVSLLQPNQADLAQQKLKYMDLARLAEATGQAQDVLEGLVRIDHTLDPTDPEAVNDALPSGPGHRNFVLMKEVTPEQTQAVTALDFFGVSVDLISRRYYPDGLPSATVLGFMSGGEDGHYKGRAGIEGLLDEALAGRAGRYAFVKTAGQKGIRDLGVIDAPTEPQDVILTLDARLQYVLYQALETAGRTQAALSATGVLMDVKTGEILAMSAWPTFNPNNLATLTGANQRNKAVIDVFEPGSVVKPLTIAAALTSGKYSIHSRIDTTPGSMRVGGYSIRDSGNYGVMDFEALIKKSSNVASAKIALSLPADAIYKTQRDFGFGQKTALGLPGELAGTLNAPSEKEVARRATLSYGYGQEVTAVQVVQAYATLANGGVRMPLSIVKSDTDFEPVQVIDPSHARAILKMMTSVTQDGGTGRLAAISGYQVAGKTGTSRRASPAGGYYPDQYRALFAGVAPASDPRFAAVIVIEDPSRQKYGGQVAAPVFSQVMGEALRLYRVPHDTAL